MNLHSFLIMSQPRYEDDAKKYDAVRHCINKRLTYEESKPFLVKLGYSLSPKQFQRIKKRINDINDTKISEVSKIAYTQFTLDSLDELCFMKHEFEKWFKNTENFWEKKASSLMILKINDQIARTLDSSDIVDKI